MPPPGGAAIRWRGDFETGNLSQWSGVHCLADRVRVVTSPVRQGTYAARFEVQEGDDPIGSGGERCELKKSTGEGEGVESWWAWSTYFPDDFNPNPSTSWNIYTQWHGTDATGQPNVAFDASPASDSLAFVLKVRGGSATTPTVNRFSLGPVGRNHWYDFVFHVYWSSSGGFIELWLDGANIIERTQMPTLYAGQGVYLKQGFYRGASELTTVLLHDGARWGETCADVDCPEPPIEVDPIVPANESPPTVNGTSQEGGTLAADVGIWSGTSSSYTFEWRRCDGDGASCTSILGATLGSYRLTAAEIDSTIRVAVTATNPAGSATAYSVPTAVVLPAPPVNTVLPKISGTLRVGRTLTTDGGVWTSSRPIVGYSYRWLRCKQGASCADISGATSKSYVLVAADANATIRVVVTAANAGGATSAVSARTTVVRR